MWINDVDRKPEKSHLSCPVSGRELFDYGSDWNVLGGPTYLQTKNGEYRYELWPRQRDRLYPAGGHAHEEPVYPNKHITGMHFEIVPDGYIGFYEVHEFRVEILCDYVQTRCNLYHAQHVVEKRLREIEYEKWRATSKQMLGDITSSPFDAIAFPIVRRVCWKTMAHDLVSVQPLSMPKGLVFHMDYKYKKQKSRVPKWIWNVTDKTVLTHDGGALAQRGTTTRSYELFGVTIWKKKSVFIS